MTSRCWASNYIQELQTGSATEFRPRGGSMVPLIHSGQLCRVEPIDPSTLCVGDIVLCRVRGSTYLHLIKAIAHGRFQIGNNRGGINGWTSPEQIFGRLTSVRD